MDLGKIIGDFRDKPHYYENVECLEKHIEKYFINKEVGVFHEFISVDFHLDVYFIKPSNRNYNMLLTSGMSLLAMNVDADIQAREDYLFSELMLLLPKDVDFGDGYTGKEKNSWMISMLKDAARFPHHYDTFLAKGHTIQATADMEPYDNSIEFIGCVILPSVTFDDDFTSFNCGERKIKINSVFPLYKNELAYKVDHGYKKFLELLNKANAQEIFDQNRKNLIEG